jgi:hypothetical protein
MSHNMRMPSRRRFIGKLREKRCKFSFKRLFNQLPCPGPDQVRERIGGKSIWIWQGGDGISRHVAYPFLCENLRRLQHRHYMPPVRPREDPLLQTSKEPGASVYALCTRQPVLEATEARSMRRSLPIIGQTTAQSAQTPRKSLEMAPVLLESAFKRQHRRCRKR